MRVDFFFDPVCPWCWITSRWIAEVQSQRGLDVRWRTFSLLEKNRATMPAEYLERVQAGHNTLRIAEALRASEGEAAVADFYTELGASIHNDKTSPDAIDLRTVLRSSRLAESWAESARDESWDAVINASMKEALDLAGDDVGVPLIAIDQKRAYFGPVMTPAPQGKDALRLWDVVTTLTDMPYFYELKNSARATPQFADRPNRLAPFDAETSTA